jgi:cell division protein FtsL
MKRASKSYMRARTLSCQRVKVKKKPSILPGIFVVFVLIALSLFYVWSRIELLKINYTISQMQESLHVELIQKEELKGKVAQLKSPERIARIAEQKLDLAFPKPSQVWPLGIKRSEGPGAQEEEGSLKVARP